MNGHGNNSTIRMHKAGMTASLAHLDKACSFQGGNEYT